ncbi:X-Pro dipeptidyl-peptidase family protein [Hydrogenophaga sp. RAC07]|uniref:hydrolase 2, exosortase A system-associated n=1 Tax=Hydrogenophaga sp. RAC07 TaxID=1842537 RepID=UPI000858DDC3|nr:hydrolase 2, exosortase A system-associated [Hydrogenophaga sp. RAC07]AOF87744.1 X-Pro dipeptidyl-peptidase family protein [Hydrogenophaga sp. RAC07]
MNAAPDRSQASSHLNLQGEGPPATATERPGLPQAFFLPTPTGQRFCLFHPPQGAPKGRVLYLHPFAEELNTTRRAVAQQARALAQAGFAVLQIDLLGCGDSEGELVDATWEAWLQDAQHAHDWLIDHAQGPLWLWGMRGGCLLATVLAARLPQAPHLLLWQPIINGQQMLQQFLRLHAAGQWLGEGSKGESPAKALASGQSVDIAGYTLTSSLATGMGAARMQAVATEAPGRLVWLKTSTQPEPALGPAATAHLDTWRAAGWAVNAQAVTGPAFWQTVGTDEAPALIAATLQAMSADGEHAA